MRPTPTPYTHRALGWSLIGATIDQLDPQVTDIYNANELATPWYADQGEKHEVVISGE